MTQLLVNNYATTVAATFGAGDTTLQVASTSGLPVLSNGDFFLLTLFRLTGVQESGWEVVKVTSWIGNSLTIQRSYEGAAASQFLTGDRVEMRPTAKTITDKFDKAGGSLSGPINFSKSTAVASAETIDIWNTSGNLVPITGSVDILNFTNAPKAGAERLLYFVDSPKLFSSDYILIPGGTRTMSPKDRVRVIALTTTTTLCEVIPVDGQAATPPVPMPAFQHMFIARSLQAFIPKVTGWHQVTVVGSSGAAGFTVSPNNSGIMLALATGAGAPGFCQDLRWLVKDVPYICSVGAGAPHHNVRGGTNLGINTVIEADGNDSSFSGPNVIPMYSRGGKGGTSLVVRSSGSSYTVPPIFGGLGGIAEGGSLNVTGGRGGNIEGIQTSPYNGGASIGIGFSTGAGSIGITGISYNGGNIIAPSNAAGSFGSTGGAGVGGDGGSLTGSGYSSGGGYSGNGTAVTNNNGGALIPGGLSILGVPSGNNTMTLHSLYFANGGGEGNQSGQIANASFGGPGGGGSGVYATSGGQLPLPNAKYPIISQDVSLANLVAGQAGGVQAGGSYWYSGISWYAPIPGGLVGNYTGGSGQLNSYGGSSNGFITIAW